MVLGYEVLMQNHAGSNPQAREPGAHPHPDSCLQGPPQGEGESLLLYRPMLLRQEMPAFRAGDRQGPGTLRCGAWGGAYRGADLAVLCGHAVSVVQVCEGLGCSPGLQVPGHAHGGPHLGSIESVARSEEVRTPSLSLGVRNKH